MDTPPAIIRFDAFTLDLANRQLRRAEKGGSTEVELGSRYLDALALLAREAGSLVSKDRFMDEVWRGIPVTDEALTQCIRTLRRALGDDATNPRFIATVPKHGYRFLARVEHGTGEPPAVAGQPSRTSSTSLPSRVAGACTLTGALAGAAGGLFYALAAGTGAGTGVLVLAAMIGALGTLAGAGIGLALAIVLAIRGRPDLGLIPAGTAGGMATGALGSTLGREGITLLTGSQVAAVTGSFEGLMLGLASGIAAWLVLAPKIRPAIRLVGAAVIGGSAGALLHALGGVLLGGSLWQLQQALGTSRLSLEKIGGALGRDGFGPVAQLVTATAEGAVFVGLLACGMVLAVHSDRHLVQNCS
ncbi:MAG: transcriptional regulator [Erythrobacter sp.]|nr:MAG: transcriptional regulator [Erythrobacter sp.]